MSLNIVVVDEFDNVILHRKQVNFKIIHQKMATPTRTEVKNKLAAQFNADPNAVIIAKLTPRYGQSLTLGYAKIYDSPEKAQEIEVQYLLKRNQPKEQKGN